MKNILKVLFSIFILCFAFELSWGKGKLVLPNGNYLTYELGNIDESFLNGNITDVIFFDDGGEFASANNIVIKSKKTQNSEKYVIEFFQVNGYSSFDVNYTFDCQRFVVTDFPHFNYFEEFNSFDFQTRPNFSIKAFGIKIDSTEAKVEIEKISLPKILQGVLPSGQPFTSKAELEISNFSVLPNSTSKAALPALIALTALGQEKFIFDLKSLSKSEDLGVFLSSNSFLELSMKGGMEIFFGLDVLLPVQVIENYSKKLHNLNLNNSIGMDRLGQELFQDLAGIQISKMTLSVSDKGLRKPLLIMYSSNTGLSEEEGINNFINLIYSTLQQFIPVNVDNLIAPISNFLTSGGRLELNVNPPNPVAIMASLGLFMMPDLAIESLGITLEHQK